MKSLFIGVNAKYIHTNLAIRYIRDYIIKEDNSLKDTVDIVEFTINQRVEFIISEIYELNPDILNFSCYIWNYEIVKTIVKEYKKIRPDVIIILGGPEVSYDGELVLRELETVDIIVNGEGEATCSELLQRGLINKEPLSSIDGIVYRQGNQIIKNKPRMALDLDELPFVYEKGFDEFENKILYYETTRGCPFNCQYCLSSVEKGVRYRSFSLVKHELQHFLDHKVRQVKFVDRTFNCNMKHTMEIWQYLNENDNGTTNFHFEISVDLLDDEVIDFLSTVRPGLFQFEIGVQSTKDETLEIIKRKNDFALIEHNVNRLQEGNNIHLHLDLIAGLPLESYDEFQTSFNDVYRLKPEQLQLGFLKVLKGSGIYELRDSYDIRYSGYAPYEVFSTSVISYGELQRLKKVEEMLEQYYNSNLFYNTIAYLEGFYESPFKIYEEIADYWVANSYHKVNHSRISIITILKDFCEAKGVFNNEIVRALLKFDMCLHEKVKKFPDWYKVDVTYRGDINDFYKYEDNIREYLIELVNFDSKQISRMAHIEVFDFDVMNIHRDSAKEKTAILFNYHRRDGMRNDATYYKIDLNLNPVK